MTLAFALPMMFVPSIDDWVVNVEVILYEKVDFEDDRPVFSVIPSCAFVAGTNPIESNKKTELFKQRALVQKHYLEPGVGLPRQEPCASITPQTLRVLKSHAENVLTRNQCARYMCFAV